MNLDDMLALLPDNTSGAISAADLRAIVTELYGMASSTGHSWSYRWVNDMSPGAGGICTDWSTSATVLALSETTEDGETVTFSLLDQSISASMTLTTADGSRLGGTIIGASVDQGGYRTVPIQAQSVTGPVPSGSEKVTLMVIG